MKTIFDEQGNWNFDFVCKGIIEEYYQNVVLVEAIKAMNEGKVPVIIMRGTTLADGRYGALYLLKKENLEGLMNISSNPKWKDVKYLEHVIDLYYPHFEDMEECEGMNIFDSVEEAEEFIKQFDDEVGCLNYIVDTNTILKAYWDNWQHSAGYSEDYNVPKPTGRFLDKQLLDSFEDCALHNLMVDMRQDGKTEEEIKNHIDNTIFVKHTDGKYYEHKLSDDIANVMDAVTQGKGKVLAQKGNSLPHFVILNEEVGSLNAGIEMDQLPF